MLSDVVSINNDIDSRSLIIGLFGLVGMVGVAAGPFIGQVIDQLVPWYAALCSSFMLIIFQGIQTGAGGINVAAVVISTIGLDIFRQTVQVSLSSAVFEYVSTKVSFVSYCLIRL